MHRAYTRIESMLEAVDTVPDLHDADQERIKKYMEHWKEIPKVSMVGTQGLHGIVLIKIVQNLRDIFSRSTDTGTTLMDIIKCV